MRGPKEFAERTAKNHSEYDKNETVENVKRILGQERPKTFSDCIKWVNQHKIFHKKSPLNVGFCGEYRSRTDDLLHAMQTL